MFTNLILSTDEIIAEFIPNNIQLEINATSFVTLKFRKEINNTVNLAFNYAGPDGVVKKFEDVEIIKLLPNISIENASTVELNITGVNIGQITLGLESIGEPNLRFICQNFLAFLTKIFMAEFEIF
ncbi:hypothetical protein HELRODRAFT_177247 [Helobdella robusta]|uniref:Uncharacterized protein n=1 Tax=Helobdella robusta TaxID=6412 RepID=T1FBE6_HELRO|nr:hypothetical protein HELRODRAFT_177247 [Helobdella robusta]ESN98364.1 hypothetical protein HELRODRAFT_177247 [Helobdella robusta]